MPQPTFHVLAPGLLSTLQDLGRPGFQSQGVSVGGAMDRHAAAVANLLVGNPPSAAVLEMTQIGPALLALRDTRLAVCGADLSPSIEAVPVPLWHTAALRQGQTLRFGRPSGGAWTSLAVAGGFAVPRVLGSRATELRAGFGGFQGRALRPADVLEVFDALEVLDAPEASPKDAAPLDARRAGHANDGGRGLRAGDIPCYPPHVCLRIILGPDHALFTDHVRDTFLSARFAVSPQSGRMGYRLQGPPLALHSSAPDTLPSAGVACGCVQVAGGQLLLLMADCQTTGGYPVIGTVIGADLAQAAQCAPGTTVSFRTVSLNEAHAAWRAQTRFLRTLAGAALLF